MRIFNEIGERPVYQARINMVASEVELNTFESNIRKVRFRVLVCCMV